MADKRDKENLVWLDMEMTGLDPRREGIIEIATIVTDKHLRILAEGPHLVVHQPKRLLDRMDRWNRRQHRKSGLVELVRKSKISVRKAEDTTLEFVREYCFPASSPLCGNAIHHDRRFIIQYMPRLHKFLHYRHVDVSTLKHLAKIWYGKRFRPFEKQDRHRALDDIRESIQELLYYRKKLFKR